MATPLRFTDRTDLIEDTTHTTAWACDECGALVVDRAGDYTSRDQHNRWHANILRSFNYASMGMGSTGL